MGKGVKRELLKKLLGECVQSSGVQYRVKASDMFSRSGKAVVKIRRKDDSLGMSGMQNTAKGDKDE